MNGPIWLGWLVVVLLAVLSIALLMGKGSFLIAGFNTSSKQEKQKYNVRRLCYIMGGGFGIITIITGIVVFYEGELPNSIQWLVPWGLLSVIAVMIILGNTICKNKSEHKK